MIARYPAGKGINISRGLAAMGRSSVASGFVGAEDERLFAASLKDAGVMSRLVEVEGRTRENITIIDPKNHTDTHIRESGFTVSAEDIIRLMMMLTAHTTDGGIVAFAGSLPGGVSGRELRALVVAAKTHGANIVLDTGGRVLREMLELGPVEETPAIFAIKPNRVELAELIGVGELTDDSALLAAARGLTDKVRWVVASMGAEGAWIIGRDGAWRGRLPLDVSRLINTVGCGDCLLAGVIDGLTQGREPDGALRRGLAAAAANAMDAGIARFGADQVCELEAHAVVDRVF